LRFIVITGGAQDADALTAEYASARAFGTTRVGARHLFFCKGLRVCAAAYAGLARCYRRVMLVPARLCCGRGDLELECLVLENDQGELAQIQLPGRKAAVAALEEIRKHAPSLETRCPDKARKEVRA